MSAASTLGPSQRGSPFEAGLVGSQTGLQKAKDGTVHSLATRRYFEGGGSQV